MTGFDDPAFFGDRWASVYGEGDEGSEPVAEAEFLARLGRDGRVLELAIGTGRVALPLAASRRARSDRGLGDHPGLDSRCGRPALQEADDHVRPRRHAVAAVIFAVQLAERD